MAMDLDAAIYLQRNGMLTSAKNKVLDIGPQNVYNARDGQIREFVINQSSTADPAYLESEIKRLVYFSTPRPEERTTLFSEITDLTNIEYNSIDVCPGLKTEILDLNFDALPSHMANHFDVVFNFGTTEHIFNQWNCFEVIHDAMKVEGITYHQLPASGYLDHGYYCYTPLFFGELAKANDYIIEHIALTPAGDSRIDRLGIEARSGSTLFYPTSALSDNNRIPSLNIHVILRKTKDKSFRANLEIATAHAKANSDMLIRYSGTPSVVPTRAIRDELAAIRDELAAIKASLSWRVTQPLRTLSNFAKRMLA